MQIMRNDNTVDIVITLSNAKRKLYAFMDLVQPSSSQVSVDPVASAVGSNLKESYIHLIGPAVLLAS